MGSLWVTMVGNRCPYCQKGELFSGWFELHEKCPECGSVYGRQPGAWLGPTVAGYAIGGIIGIVGGVIIVQDRYYFPHAELWLAGTACTTVVVSFRYLKAAWVGWLYDAGYIYPDPD